MGWNNPPMTWPEFESTLSGRYLFKFILSLKEKGYQIRIMFIFVDSPDILIERIAERVKKAGILFPKKTFDDVLSEASVIFLTFMKTYLINGFYTAIQVMIFS